MRAAAQMRMIGSDYDPRGLAFRKRLREFKTKYVSLWHAPGSNEPEIDERFEPAAQRENEKETDRLIRHVEDRLEHCPESAEDREIWRAQLVEQVRQFGRRCFRFPDQYLNVLLSDDYFRATSAFARQAEAFDRNIEPDALSQALRNVWVMNCLQRFLGNRISMPPSIFAYSMLYPYTDNLLDDAEITADSKRKICTRLGLRLEGARVEPEGRRERDIYRLVAMIEGEYDRPGFPDVYHALLAIHRGQVRSLLQQDSGPIPDDDRILEISVEKGGASVLADGYLVAGKLSGREADFCFGFGAVLQLFDDLQDVTPDIEAGRWTLFSRNAHRLPLDGLASRLHRFLLNVLRSADRFRISAQPVLKDLIRRNCGFLLLQAVSQNQDLFDRSYLRRLEPHSPLRFGYLKSLRAVITPIIDRLSVRWRLAALR